MLRTIRTQHNPESGLTFLELIVVITIFAIMASIVIFKFQDFGSKTTLDNLAQDVALRVVEAQKTAISGGLNANFLGTVAAPTYGVYFASGSASDSFAHQFIYFTDIPAAGFTTGNKMYDVSTTGTCAGGAGNECISTTSITSGEYITRLCYVEKLTSRWNCPTLSSPSTDSAHITFTRPFPKASISICPSTAACPSPIAAQSLYVELTSGIDPTMQKTIVVNGLGEVRVDPSCAPVAAGRATSC